MSSLELDGPRKTRYPEETNMLRMWEGWKNIMWLR